MNKLMEWGRRTMFYIRVLSGYEEQRIRAMRIQMEEQLKQAKQRREAIKRLPEQTILKEIRSMVERMQKLNKSLDDTEAAIENHFKPFDKEMESLMNAQLDVEAERMKMILQAAKQEMISRELAQARNHAKQLAAQAHNNPEMLDNGNTKISHQQPESPSPQQNSGASAEFNSGDPFGEFQRT